MLVSFLLIFYGIYDVRSDTLFYFYLQCILCYSLDSTIVGSRLHWLCAPFLSIELIRSGIALLQCVIVYSCVSCEHKFKWRETTKPLRCHNHEFISRKCLLSYFDPVIAYPWPKRWRTVKKLTQKARDSLAGRRKMKEWKIRKSVKSGFSTAYGATFRQGFRVL